MTPFIIAGLLLAVAAAGQITNSHRRSAHRRAAVQAYRSGAAQ